MNNCLGVHLGHTFRFVILVLRFWSTRSWAASRLRHDYLKMTHVDRKLNLIDFKDRYGGVRGQLECRTLASVEIINVMLDGVQDRACANVDAIVRMSFLMRRVKAG